MGIYIETPRLYIREMLPEDAEGMFEMDSDPEVHRYVGNRPIKTIDESADVIEFVRKQYIDNGVGRWAVIEKETNKFVGWTGFKLILEMNNGHINHYDFGYRFMQRAWGKGYASESGYAALHYGIEKCGFSPVYAMTDVNNGVSRHILEKLGFRFKEIFKFDEPTQWRDEANPWATWYELPK